MAPLRKHHDDVNQNPDESQSTFDFDSTEDSAANVESAEITQNAEGESYSKKSDTAHVVVKRKRVVKKAENPSSEEKTEEQSNFKKNPVSKNNYTKKTTVKRNYQSYPTPSGEVSESITQAEAASTGSEDNANKPRLLINDLTIKSMPELRELAMQYGFTADDLAPMKKQDLIFVILKAHTEHGGIIFASGALEILPDGYGFLRSPQNSYLPGPDDIYISPSQIRLFNLKTGTKASSGLWLRALPIIIIVRPSS